MLCFIKDYQNHHHCQKYWSPLVGAYGNLSGRASYYNAPGTGHTAKHKPQPVQSPFITGLWE